MAFYEHNKRSITKALTFRGVILVSDGIIFFSSHIVMMWRLR